MFKKFASITLVAALVFSLNGMAVFATTKELDVESVTQEKSKWCWAACTQCVSDYLGGNEYSQRKIVKKVKGSTDNETATYKEVVKALDYDGIDTTYKNGIISFSKLKTQINNDSPIIASYAYSDDDGDLHGHDVVIYGYRTDDESVVYMDPLNGKKYRMTYDEFVDDGKYYWDHTYYKNEVE